MEEGIKTLEEAVLNRVVENKTPVRICFTTGYQTIARILDFDCEVFLLQVEKNDRQKEWMVYRHAVSTIDLG